MNDKKIRLIYGIIYINIMWFSTICSDFSFKILFGLLAIISTYEMLKIRKNKSKLIPFLYIIIPYTIILFTSFSKEKNIILLMFILIWTFDTFAYIFGTKFGKTKMIPSISPKKSWEGFIGGFFSSIIISFFASLYFNEISFNKIMIMSIFLPFTATTGDFIESYYKRQAEIKDSSNLIPGHGGILDRMDAFMISIPVLYIYSKII